MLGDYLHEPADDLLSLHQCPENDWLGQTWDDIFSLKHFEKHHFGLFRQLLADRKVVY